VEDPDAWWKHATETDKIDEEKALAEKISKWKPSYDEAIKDKAYLPRSKRPDTDPAVFVEALEAK